MNEPLAIQILPQDIFKNFFPNLPLLDVLTFRLVSNTLKESADDYLMQTLSIKQLACGVSHSIALLAEGRVLVWGSNAFGQLGLGQLIAKANRPREIWGIENIIQVATDGWHSLFLTENHEVLACGSNMKQQLGFPETKIFFPQKIPNIENAQSIATGYSSIAILKNAEEIQSSGSTKHLKTHSWNNKIVLIPNHISIPSCNDIQDISATSSHALLLKDGYAYGTGDEFLLGLGVERTDDNRWQPIEILKNDGTEISIKKILAVDTASLLLGTDGELFVTGFNNMGHLGPNTGDNPGFAEIDHHKKIQDFASNRSHTLILNEDNELLAMGCNNEGELGVDNTTTASTDNTATKGEIKDFSQENNDDIFNDDIFMSGENTEDLDQSLPSMPAHHIINRPTYVDGFFKLKRELVTNETKLTPATTTLKMK